MKRTALEAVATDALMIREKTPSPPPVPELPREEEAEVAQEEQVKETEKEKEPMHPFPEKPYHTLTLLDETEFHRIIRDFRVHSFVVTECIRGAEIFAVIGN